ncbi:MAG TPA: hypothetical protein VGO11_00255 [Chthoniobacteraceae bacterium]|nr:hypothetical protein [Chthoniobacteraceae bacterium]
MGGVGAIITSYTPVHRNGRILTHYAMIDHDDRIADWKKVIDRVHAVGEEVDKATGQKRSELTGVKRTKFIIQLSHSGRQRDEEGFDNYRERIDTSTREEGILSRSSTSRKDPVFGFRCKAMTIPEIEEMIGWFADGALRAKKAGADGIETHSANGYLFTQFLSSAINDRKDKYGGELPGRARFLMEVIRAIRQKRETPDGERVLANFHFQAKISAEEYDNAVIGFIDPFEWFFKRGNTIKDSTQVAQWAVDPKLWVKAWNEYAGRSNGCLAPEKLEDWDGFRGVDALHVSSGSTFPHKSNPPGELPVNYFARTSEIVISTGAYTFRNFVALRYVPSLFRMLWDRTGKNYRSVQVKNALPVPGDAELVERFKAYQGVSLNEAKAIREAVHKVDPAVHVIVTGGFQQRSYVESAIDEGFCDGVAIARPLVANNNLVQQWREGRDLPEKPCTYCNKCLISDIRDPLGCYEESRYDGDYHRMWETITQIFRKSGTTN